jgi:prevent-host-death family protein
MAAYAEAVRGKSEGIGGAVISKETKTLKSKISATDAARRFSEILDRVQYRKESFVVTLRGEPVCEIVPVQPDTFTGRDLVALLRSLPHPDKEYLDTVEERIRNQPPFEKSKWPR